jgi:hypothetical protein
MTLKQIGVHLAYIVTLVLGIGMCIFIIVAIKGQRDNMRAEYLRREAARVQCRTWADRFGGDLKETGEYRKYNDADDGVLPERDPWGRPIRYKYERGGIKEILKILSNGPDGKENTRDDIIETRQSVRHSLFNRNKE